MLHSNLKTSLKSSLCRKVYFSAAHRYFVKDWTDQKNREHFGSCYSENGHGHNYVLEAAFSGPVDDQSGMIINLVEVDKMLKELVEPLDHSFINTDIPYFKDKVPTTENICLYLTQSLLEQIKEKAFELNLERVTLHENDDLWVEVKP